MSDSNRTWTSRREPYLSGSPQYTPWEENSNHVVELEGNPVVIEPPRESFIPTRRPQHRVVFFLQPTGIDGRWGDWFAAAFLQGKTFGANERNTPRGRFTLPAERRNINVPSSESYGDLVGASDGVSPYGLE